jgi:hypothetical protein
MIVSLFWPIDQSAARTPPAVWRDRWRATPSNGQTTGPRARVKVIDRVNAAVDDRQLVLADCPVLLEGALWQVWQRWRDVLAAPMRFIAIRASMSWRAVPTKTSGTSLP